MGTFFLGHPVVHPVPAARPSRGQHRSSDVKKLKEQESKLHMLRIRGEEQEEINIYIYIYICRDI